MVGSKLLSWLLHWLQCQLVYIGRSNPKDALEIVVEGAGVSTDEEHL